MQKLVVEMKLLVGSICKQRPNTEVLITFLQVLTPDACVSSISSTNPPLPASTPPSPLPRPPPPPPSLPRLPASSEGIDWLM